LGLDGTFSKDLFLNNAFNRLIAITIPSKDLKEQVLKGMLIQEVSDRRGALTFKFHNYS